MAALKKNEQINVPTINVDKNVMAYGSSFICTDNISMISISPIPSNKSWWLALLIGLMGIYIKSILVIIIAIVWLVLVFIYNSNRGDNLAISLNSGTTLYFNCKNRSFLDKVVHTMICSIKEKNKSTYTISFDRCQISGGVFNESSFIEN